MSRPEVATFQLLGATIPIKYASLAVLIFQNSALFLFLRASRTQGGDLYKPGTAVVMSEVFKFLTSLLIIFIQEKSFARLMSKLHSGIISRPGTNIKLLVPSALYTLQGNLMFLAVTYIDAATFQVTYQLKILTTALFAVTMLGKKLSGPQWGSLVMLMVGVALIQYPENSEEKDSSSVEKLLGLAMVIAACFSSGFAGIYFEKVLKGETSSIWVLNVQLGGLGALIGFIGLMYQDGADVMDKGFFYGYTTVTWTAISLQAFGGLVVAVVVKYADNILKGFATSISIIVSCVVSVFYFDFILTGRFVIGTIFVCAASYVYGVYGLPASPASAAPAPTTASTTPAKLEEGKNPQ